MSPGSTRTPQTPPPLHGDCSAAQEAPVRPAAEGGRRVRGRQNRGTLALSIEGASSKCGKQRSPAPQAQRRRRLQTSQAATRHCRCASRGGLPPPRRRSGRRPARGAPGEVEGVIKWGGRGQKRGRAAAGGNAPVLRAGGWTRLSLQGPASRGRPAAVQPWVSRDAPHRSCRERRAVAAAEARWVAPQRGGPDGGTVECRATGGTTQTRVAATALPSCPAQGRRARWVQWQQVRWRPRLR